MENRRYKNSELAKILESEGYSYVSAVVVLNRVRPDENQALTEGEKNTSWRKPDGKSCHKRNAKEGKNNIEK